MPTMLLSKKKKGKEREGEMEERGKEGRKRRKEEKSNIPMFMEINDYIQTKKN